MAEGFDLAAERRRNLDSRAAEEKVPHYSVRLGCGTCSFWKAPGKEEGGMASSLRDVVSFHDKNIGYLERTLPSFRKRVLAGDLVLRTSVVDFSGGRSLARAMFSPTSQREGSSFSHILLQSAVLDRLVSIVTGSSSDDQQQHYLCTPLKNEAESLTRFYNIRKKSDTLGLLGLSL